MHIYILEAVSSYSFFSFVTLHLPTFLFWLYSGKFHLRFLFLMHFCCVNGCLCVLVWVYLIYLGSLSELVLCRFEWYCWYMRVFSKHFCHYFDFVYVMIFGHNWVLYIYFCVLDSPYWFSLNEHLFLSMFIGWIFRRVD